MLLFPRFTTFHSIKVEARVYPREVRRFGSYSVKMLLRGASGFLFGFWIQWVHLVFLTTVVYPLQWGLHISYWMATSWILLGRASTGPLVLDVGGLRFYERPSSVVPRFLCFIIESFVSQKF